MSCSAWDKGDEDLDGPRSARIWPLSECDYTPYSVILRPQQEGFTNDFVRLVNLAVAGCTRHGDAYHVFGAHRGCGLLRMYNSPLLLLIPSGGLVIRHPLVPLFLFTPVGSEAMNHTCPCTTLNRVYLTHERDLALYVLSRPLKAVKFSVACRLFPHFITVTH